MVNDKEVFKHMQKMITHSDGVRVLLFKKNAAGVDLIVDISEVDKQSFRKNGELCSYSKRYISERCLVADSYSIEKIEINDF